MNWDEELQKMQNQNPPMLMKPKNDYIHGYSDGYRDGIEKGIKELHKLFESISKSLLRK